MEFNRYNNKIVPIINNIINNNSKKKCSKGNTTSKPHA